MAMKDEYRHETQKSPSELEREIDLTRAHMDHTLDLLEAKLSPGELIDQVIGLARRNGGGFARNLTTQVQNNPLPALLTGVGLAWLMSASDHPPEAASRASSDNLTSSAREHADDVSEWTREATRHAQEGGHALGEHAHEMSDRAGHAASRAREGMHDTAARARLGMHGAADSARRSSRRMTDEYQHLLQEQPLLLGGLGLALGAALGAMMPHSDAEDELLGPYADRMRRDIEQEGKQQYRRARDTAERAVGAAQEEVEHETGDARPH